MASRLGQGLGLARGARCARWASASSQGQSRQGQSRQGRQGRQAGPCGALASCRSRESGCPRVLLARDGNMRRTLRHGTRARLCQLSLPASALTLC